MDVNGFIFHINNSAAKNSQDRGVTEAHKMLLVDWVYLDDMKNEFQIYDSWKDLNDDSSEFVQFLKQYCEYDGEWPECVNKEKISFSMRKLKILGLLFCDGDKYEKTEELFDLA